jgi:hypothetical protein
MGFKLELVPKTGTAVWGGLKKWYGKAVDIGVLRFCFTPLYKYQDVKKKI